MPKMRRIDLGPEANTPDSGMGWAILALILFVTVLGLALAYTGAHYYDNVRPPANFNVSY